MELAEHPSLRITGSRPGRRRGDFADPDAVLEFTDAPSQLSMTL